MPKSIPQSSEDFQHKIRAEIRNDQFLSCLEMIHSLLTLELTSLYEYAKWE